MEQEQLQREFADLVEQVGAKVGLLGNPSLKNTAAWTIWVDLVRPARLAHSNGTLTETILAQLREANNNLK